MAAMRSHCGGTYIVALVLLLLALSAALVSDASPPQDKPLSWTILAPPSELGQNADFGSAVSLIAVRDRCGDRTNNDTTELIFAAIGAQNAGKVDKQSGAGTGSFLVYHVATRTVEANGTRITRPVSPPVLVQSLSPAQLGVGANFGCSLSAMGERLLVGAQYDQNSAGLVYEFEAAAEEAATTCSMKFKLSGVLKRPVVPGRKQPPPRFFGSAIAASLRDNSFVVGTASGNGTGAAFVFKQSGKEGSGSVKLSYAVDGGRFPPGSNFGQSVAALDSSAIAVGVNHLQNTSGGAFVIRHGATWVPLQPTTNLPAGSYFGSQLHPVGADLIAVSAPWAPNGGTVFLFRVGSRGAVQQVGQVARPSGNEDPGQQHTFGCSVFGLPDGRLFVGDWSANQSAGMVFEFTVDGASGAATLVRRLSAKFPAATSNCFGSSTSVVRDVALVGAFGAFGDIGGAAFTIL